MESSAEPGSILVSGATYKLVKDFFEFKTLGKFEVKGKEQPQEAYQLIKASTLQPVARQHFVTRAGGLRAERLN